MEREQFEILLEKIESNTRTVVEAVAGNTERMDRMDVRLGTLEGDVHELKGGMWGLKAGQEELGACMAGLKTDVDEMRTGLDGVKKDIREMKGTMGILVPIANNQELRIQVVENTLQDHLKDHS